MAGILPGLAVGSGSFFLYHSYSIVFVTFLVWCYTAVVYGRSRAFSPDGFLGRYRFELALPWLLIAVIAWTVQPYFNVPTFEMGGVGVAKSMALHKTIVWRQDLLCPNDLREANLQSLIDFKPLLFPFLVSLLHSILGYNLQHVFWLNLLVGGSLLTAVYLCARRFGGALFSFSVLVLIAAAPVFSMCVRTAASDLFSATMLILFLFLLYDFMRAPSSASFGFVWMSLVLTAQGREENVIYPILVLSALLCLRAHIKREHLKANGALIAATPLFLAPVAWLRLVKMNAWTGEQKGTPQFHPEFFLQNLKDFFAAQLDFGPASPYNTPMHWLAVAIAGWALYHVFFTRQILRKTHERHHALVSVLCLGAFYTLIFSWWYPNLYQDSLTVRFFLIFSVLCAVTPLVIAAKIGKAPRWLTAAVLAFGLVSFVMRHPLAMEGRFIASHLYCKEMDVLRDFLKKYNPRRPLLIMPQAFRAISLDIDAVDPWVANHCDDHFLGELASGRYSHILVIERLRSKNAPINASSPTQGASQGAINRRPISVPVASLKRRIKLRKITEVEIPPWHINRISRVVLTNRQKNRNRIT